jgi:hypothetical protein
MYKLVNKDGLLVCVKKQNDNIVLLIPIDPDNTDYQEYLKWVAEGNEPLPADE